MKNSNRSQKTSGPLWRKLKVHCTKWCAATSRYRCMRCGGNNKKIQIRTRRTTANVEKEFTQEEEEVPDRHAKGWKAEGEQIGGFRDTKKVLEHRQKENVRRLWSVALRGGRHNHRLQSHARLSTFSVVGRGTLEAKLKKWREGRGRRKKKRQRVKGRGSRSTSVFRFFLFECFPQR